MATDIPRSEPEARPAEPQHIAALLTGPVRPPTWRQPAPPPADFFAAKGALAGMLDTLRVPWSVRATDHPEPFLHPGRCGEIAVAGEPAGWIGEIHPSVAASWDEAGTVAAFELDLDRVTDHATPVTIYRDVTSFPEVREDLAVIVSDAVTAEDVLAVVRRAGAPLLTAAEIFDVYRDQARIGAGSVSLALRLHFRAGDRTLTDAEVAAKRGKIAAALAEQLQGRVRDS